MPTPEYFIASGDLKLAFLDPTTGLPLNWVDIGEAPQVEFNPTVEYADAFSTGKAGPNLQNLHVPIKRTATLSVMAMEELIANLELFWHGTKSSETAGSYSVNAAFPSSTIAIGDTWLLPGATGHAGIAAVVIKDSAGTPITLANGTDYTVNDAGFVTFLAVPGVQPYKAFSYTYKASTSLKIFSKTPAEAAVFFDGNNLAVPGERLRAIFDRVAFAPAAKIGLKAGSATGTSNAPQDYSLTGTALLGVGKVATDGYGSYFKY